jgi:hypothetical protein
VPGLGFLPETCKQQTALVMQILTGSGLKSEENCFLDAATAWPAKGNHQAKIDDNLS